MSFFWLALIFLFIAGVLDRVREVGIFDYWRWEFMLRFKSGVTTDWLLNLREVKAIQIGKLRIPLHPIFWDGYHWTKNSTVLLFLVLISIETNWWFFVWGAVVWYVAQQVIKQILVGKV